MVIIQPPLGLEANVVPALRAARLACGDVATPLGPPRTTLPRRPCIFLMPLNVTQRRGGGAVNMG